MKIVINDRNGGFGLSTEAMLLYRELKGIPLEQSFSIHNINRDDVTLVSVVLLLGERASDVYSRLKIVEIPDGTDYFIQDHGGMEWIAESHRTWR